MYVCVKQFTSLNVEFIQNNKTIEKVDCDSMCDVCVCVMLWCAKRDQTPYMNKKLHKHV